MKNVSSHNFKEIILSYQLSLSFVVLWAVESMSRWSFFPRFGIGFGNRRIFYCFKNRCFSYYSDEWCIAADSKDETFCQPFSCRIHNDKYYTIVNFEIYFISKIRLDVRPGSCKMKIPLGILVKIIIGIFVARRL